MQSLFLIMTEQDFFFKISDNARKILNSNINNISSYSLYVLLFGNKNIENI